MKAVKKFFQTGVGKIRAFSLVELSLVLVIVSILLAGSLTVSRTAIYNTQTQVTQDRLKQIGWALGNFVRNNRRLPCPGVFTNLKTSSSYGAEASTPGTCSSTLTGSGSNASNLVMGMVPVQALGLSADMAEDGYGTRFTYTVNKLFTVAVTSLTSNTGFEIADSRTSVATLIDVKDQSTSGPDAALNALYVVVSHGANKYGGYSPYSTVQNSTSSITDEQTNYYASTYDNIFVINSTTTNYDDLVLFKTKSQIAYEAGFELMTCSLTEATYSCSSSNITFTDGTNYGVLYGSSFTAPTGQDCTSKSCSGGAVRTVRQCGKYGTWTTTSNPCT